jgi:predicted DNA-binding transcriptional regulator AlpA
MPIATAEPSSTETPRKLMLRRHEAAAACGKGTSTWDKLVAAGMTPKPTKLGGTLLWNVEELAAWTRHGCPPRSEWEAIWKSPLTTRHR